MFEKVLLKDVKIERIEVKYVVIFRKIITFLARVTCFWIIVPAIDGF